MFSMSIKTKITTATGEHERETKYIFRSDGSVRINEWTVGKWRHYGQWRWDNEQQAIVITVPVTIDGDRTFCDEKTNSAWTDAYVRRLNKGIVRLDDGGSTKQGS